MNEERYLCEVCLNEPGCGVAAVPGLPMSVSYGKRCLQERANPFWALRANVMICGGVEQMDPVYLDCCITYLDGEYQTLRTALEKKPITPQEQATLDDGVRYCDLPLLPVPLLPIKP